MEKKYIKSKGMFCPHCESINIASDSPEYGDGDITVDINCYDCGKIWTELFKLKGILE